MRARIALIALAVAFVASLVAPPVAGAAAPPRRTAFLVLAPYLTWGDLSAEKTPNLWKLAEGGAVGNMNAQTGDQDQPQVNAGALTLGASGWSGAAQGAPSAYNTWETYDGQPAGVAYARYFGEPLKTYAASSELSWSPDGRTEYPQVVYLGLPAARADNSTRSWRVELGSLGQTLKQAGVVSAALGNSDTDTSTADGWLRPAALVATDASGTVEFGAVDESLLIADPSAPFGVRTDIARLSEFALGAAQQAGAGLVVVDTGDLLRAHERAWTRTDDANRSARARALNGLDDLVGELVTTQSGRPDEPAIIIVSPAVDRRTWNTPHLAPTIIAGYGFRGLLASGSTHRDGLISNLDIAPTVLGIAGITGIPEQMLGRPLSAVPASGTLGARISHLASVDAFAQAVDSVGGRIAYGWLWLVAVVTLVAGAFVVWRVRRGSWLVEAGLLFALAVPPATWLNVIPLRYATSGQQVAWSTLAWAAALWAIAMLTRRVSRWPQLPAAMLTALTAGVVVVDNLAHRPWAESGVFSYSILAGWRFYGVGNEGSALAVAAAIVAVGLVCDMAAGTRAERMLRLGLMPAVGVVTLVALAGPMFGANAGVAVWGVLGFGVAWPLVAGVRVTWKVVVAALVAVALLVGAFAVLDTMRGSGGTHLARLVTSISAGDVNGVTTLVLRKADNAYRFSLMSSVAKLAVFLALVWAILWFEPKRHLRAALEPYPGLRGAIVGVIVAGLVATISEDSGAAMPGYMWAVAACAGLFVVLRSTVLSEPTAVSGAQPWPQPTESETASTTIDPHA